MRTKPIKSRAAKPSATVKRIACMLGRDTPAGPVTWYILRALGQHEWQAVAAIKRLGGHAVVPYEAIYRKAVGKGGKRVPRAERRPILPGYVFAGFAGCPPWADLYDEESIIGRVVADGMPATLSDAAVDRLRQITRTPSAPAHHRGMRKGDRAEITSGPFVGLQSIIQDISGEAIEVEVELFGRKTPTALRADQVRRVA